MGRDVFGVAPHRPRSAQCQVGRAVILTASIAPDRLLVVFSTATLAIWNGTTPTALNLPQGARSGEAFGINNAGQIVGSVFNLNVIGGANQAVIWNGTTPTTLSSLPGATASAASAINNSGQIVGWSDVSGNRQIGPAPITHATLWNGGVPTDLGTLGGRNSSAGATNDIGQISGLKRCHRKYLLPRHHLEWRGSRRPWDLQRELQLRQRNK